MTEREFLKRKAILNLQAVRLHLEEGNFMEAWKRLKNAVVLWVEAMKIL